MNRAMNWMRWFLDDAELQHPQELDLAERLERLIYLSDDRHIAGKFVAGRRIF